MDAKRPWYRKWFWIGLGLVVFGVAFGMSPFALFPAYWLHELLRADTNPAALKGTSRVFYDWVADPIIGMVILLGPITAAVGAVTALVSALAAFINACRRFMRKRKTISN